MIIQTTEERLLVISDLHIGNPYSLAKDGLAEFLNFALREDWHLCVNGDGFEILQASFARLATDSMEVLGQLGNLVKAGLNVYYVVGNHDIVLEHMLETTLVTHISPFLNVRSGSRRIRIEHGHLYDPFFVKHPDLYEVLTRAAGPLLHLSPDVYRFWSRYQEWKDQRSRRKSDKSGQPPSVYYDAAELLLVRGFDTVIFGHTHKPEHVRLESGQYVNSGTWMQGSTYVQIDRGKVTLKKWERRPPS